jgi:hypothetical protein
MNVTITAQGYQGIRGTLIETLPDGSVYVEFQRKGIDLAPRRMRLAPGAYRVSRPRKPKPQRVTVTRGSHRGKLATVTGTDPQGRYILRVDNVFAPVFLAATSVKVAA